MGKPTVSDILKLQFSVDGSPWLKIGKAGTDLGTLKYSVDATPWVGVEEPAPTLFSTIDGSSGFVGTLQARGSVEGQISGMVSLSGALSRRVAILSPIPSSSSFGGEIKSRIGINATLWATSSVSGLGRGIGRPRVQVASLSGTVARIEGKAKASSLIPAGTTFQSRILARARFLTSIAGSSADTVKITGRQVIQSQISDPSAVAAALSGKGRLSSSVSGLGWNSGELSQRLSLHSGVSCWSDLIRTLKGKASMQMEVVCDTSLTSRLAAIGLLNAWIQGGSTISPELDVKMEIRAVINSGSNVRQILYETLFGESYFALEIEGTSEFETMITNFSNLV